MYQNDSMYGMFGINISITGLDAKGEPMAPGQ